jgi:hypothetical protein
VLSDYGHSLDVYLLAVPDNHSASIKHKKSCLWQHVIALLEVPSTIPATFVIHSSFQHSSSLSNLLSSQITIHSPIRTGVVTPISSSISSNLLCFWSYAVCNLLSLQMLPTKVPADKSSFKPEIDFKLHMPLMYSCCVVIRGIPCIRERACCAVRFYAVCITCCLSIGTVCLCTGKVPTVVCRSNFLFIRRTLILC